MLQHSLPFTDILVEYYPFWGNQPTLLDIIGGGALVVVPLFLIVLLARYEMKLVPPLTALRLLSLRLVVFFLILLLLGFQPVLTWPKREKLPEVVVIAVDRSGSMEVTDANRPPADKLKLALALHLNGKIASDLQLEEWIEQLATPHGIQWVGKEEYAGDTERRGQLEQERRQQFDEVCKRVDALSRTAVEKGVLDADGVDLIKKLREHFLVELVAFDRTTRSLKHDQLAELFEKQPDPHAAEYTHIALPLLNTLDRDRKGSKVRGVILLSDGRNNAPSEAAPDDTPDAVATKMGARNTNMPVFPIGLGLKPVASDNRSPAPPNVSITSVIAPDSVLKDPLAGKNDNIDVKAMIRVSDLPEQDLRVELLLDGKVIDHKIVKHTGKQDYPVTFSTNLSKEGSQKLTVRVGGTQAVPGQPLPPVPGVGFAGNNERSTLVKVVEDFCEALLIDGEARWEYHYLANALQRDSLVNKHLDKVIFEQPRIYPSMTDGELKEAGYAVRTLPAEDDGLTPYDCIVLGDVSPAQLPMKERQRLYDYVTKRGGTLVIVAGKRFMPQLFASLKTEGSAGSETDPLMKLLPITNPHVLNMPDGFQVTLTDDGRQTPLLKMEGNPLIQTEEDLAKQRPADEIQKHYWAVVGDAKPGATVLGYVAYPPTKPGKVRDEQRQKQGLIVQQSFGAGGRGKVLYLGIDSTWRWRYKTGDRFHHYFWGQLIRWATGNKLLEGGNAEVRFGSEQELGKEPGKEVKVVMRLGEKAAKEKLAEPRMRILRIRDDGEELVALVPLTRRDGQPRVWEGRFQSTAEGNYRIEPEVPELASYLPAAADANAPRPNAAIFTVSIPESKEMSDLSPDWEQLQKIAQNSRSDGHVYSADEADAIVKALKNLDEKEEERPQIRLPDWWPVFVVVMLLLSLEWVGRKLAGLP
jgi:hypothetical protein